MNEVLLGFHLRVSPAQVAPWDIERRTKYLLDEQVITPLSVDRTVWPSSREQSLYADLFSDYVASTNASPNGLETYEVKGQPALAMSCHDNSVLIGLTALRDVASQLISRHAIKPTALSVHQLRDSGWLSLGYDVADCWLCSGLMNCGFTSPQKLRLAKEFGHDLTPHGLFSSVDRARAFCTDCDSRIPEHSPFFVYGLWRQEV